MSLIQWSWMRIVPLHLEQVQDHALEDQQAGERDDERGHADPGHDRALPCAEGRHDSDRDGDREQSRYRRDDPEGRVVVTAGKLELGDRHRREAAEVADREVDLAEQEDEDDAVRQHGGPGRLDDDVVEVVGGEEVRGLEAEEDDDEDEAEDDRQHTEIPRPQVVERPLPDPLLRLGLVSLGEPDAGCGDLGFDFCHVASSGTFSEIPATFVGTPAVIACTTSCCVVGVSLVDADVATEPEDRDPRRDLEDVVQVVRDEHHGEALLGEALDEIENLTRLRDPERGRRLVEDDELRVPLHGFGYRNGLPLATRERGDQLSGGADRRDGQRLQRLRGVLLHRRLLETPEPVALLPAEVHVLDDVEVVAEREILVDDLDAELGRVLRPADRHGSPLEEDLARVEAVDAGDALDERGLAGAVVADERHHLAVPHLEVDVGERLHRPVGLRDSAELEERGRCLAQRGAFPTTPSRGGTRTVPPRARCSRDYLQYFLYSPVQTSLRFRKPSVKSRL